MNGVFDNQLVQDDLYHYFGMLVNGYRIYETRKREKMIIWNLMVRHFLDISDYYIVQFYR